MYTPENIKQVYYCKYETESFEFELQSPNYIFIALSPLRRYYAHFYPSHNTVAIIEKQIIST